MVEIDLTTDIPQNRQVVLSLPESVPPGKARIRVRVEPEPVTVYEVDLSGPPFYLPSPPTDARLKGDFEAFVGQWPDLEREFAEQFVAFRHGSMVARGESAEGVLREVRERFGDDPIYICQVKKRPWPGPRSGIIRVLDKGACP
jgi:hypothetical protein